MEKKMTSANDRFDEAIDNFRDMEKHNRTVKETGGNRTVFDDDKLREAVEKIIQVFEDPEFDETIVTSDDMNTLNKARNRWV